MKPRCWTSDSRCKFASQQRLEGLEGPSTSHCALAQLLPGRARGEQLESSFWPAVQRWWAEPRERRGGAPGVGQDPAAFTRGRLVWGALEEGLLLSVLGGVHVGSPLPRTQVSVGTLARSAEGAGLERAPGSERAPRCLMAALPCPGWLIPLREARYNTEITWEELMLRNDSLSVGCYYSLSIRNSNLTGHPVSSCNSGK